MSLATLLMRCLLCMAQVLNGASAAAASVRMLDMGSGAQAASGERSDAHDLDCAGHASEPEDRGSPSGRDCCKSASCPCACVQGCATAMDTPTDTPVIIVHTGVVPTPVLEHPAPALPHLIRPPIG